MTVAELLQKLLVFPPDLEVTISDGFDFRFYRGNYSVELIEVDDESCVDIGVGGCEVDFE
jgi:hypothetical protein